MSAGKSWRMALGERKGEKREILRVWWHCMISVLYGTRDACVGIKVKASHVTSSMRDIVSIEH